jgi:hypothetical protein
MTGWTFTGFERRQRRVVARFRRDDHDDPRAIPLDATTWLPVCEDEEPHPDPAVHARLVRATAQLAALAGTAHLVHRGDEPRAPGRRRRSA